ncbi:hypothetical protein ACFOHW_25085 [Paenibacillus abyssi]
MTIALIAYPLLAAIDHFTEDSFGPFVQYKKLISTIWTFSSHHWEWIAVAVITMILSRGSLSLYAPLAQEIRHNLLEREMTRWLNTPYISPLHHLYMIHPPRWIKWSDKNPFRDTFYQFIVQAFRDVVYRRYDYTEFAPAGKRPTMGEVVPKKAWVNIAIYTLLGAVLLSVSFMGNGLNFFAGYYKFMIPVVIALFVRAAVIGLAIHDHANWSKIDQQLMDTFGQKELKTRWMELFPNQPRGKAILETWKNECTMRQDRDYQFRLTRRADVSSPNHYRQTPLNHAYDNPALPLCPFPAEQLPEWAENYQDMYVDRIGEHQQKQQNEIKELAKASGGKVVAFGQRKRKG